MKVAVVGSRGLTVEDLEPYLPEGTDTIVSGGAKGIDTCARQYALSHGIALTEFLPNYEIFGKRAPLVRNDTIINHADHILIFWDGKSRGTKYVLDRCIREKKPYTLYIL